MTTMTRADAGDHSVAAVTQPKVTDAGLGTATLSDIVSLNKTSTGTYVHNDGFAIADNSPDQTVSMGQLMEFVKGYDQLGKLYNESVGDRGRLDKFQDRMLKVFNSDKDTFSALGQVGNGLIANPPTAPDQVGKQLADIFSDALKRQGGQADFTSPEWKNLQSAMAGVMIAASATFKPDTKNAQTVTMVDAMDAQLRTDSVPKINAVIWGDTKEPGIAFNPKGVALTAEQRHNQ